MKLKIKTIFTIISGLILFIGFSYAIYSGIKRKRVMKNTRFTVAITDGTYYVMKSGRQIKFYFYVDGVKYEKSIVYRSDVKKEGGRYLVEFAVEDPYYEDLYINGKIYKIPDNLEAPVEGWSSLNEVKEAIRKLKEAEYN